jgi:nickel-type superoxide dismutase maturation protease
MVSELSHAQLVDIGWWLLRRYRRLRITGNSMLPLLQPGEEILIHPTAYGQRSPAVGDLVVAAHPQMPQIPIIKRVTGITPDGQCYLQGENPDVSTDSRHFGLVSLRLLKGKVVCRFP